ncbi:hypothetical protein [Natronospira bacteriovora]|uniref:Uncharacterized protein n=1 Tax=Natronospira bacteriovora TaxID=3069753 RepID=A0ABU0W5P6_9GAMM|nr:hypothetical protein [Natronospira sp. AB-CW4]MDQ2069321.1 hypothetical protein [Natronospira sp. AB-CW4]
MPDSPTIAKAGDLKNSGFTAEQFPGHDGEFTEYLKGVLADARMEVVGVIGEAKYTELKEGDESNAKFQARQAERYFATAELWRRRKQYSDSSAMNARETGFRNLYADFEKNAQRAEEMAWSYLDLLKGPTRGTTHLQTGTVHSGLIKRELNE